MAFFERKIDGGLVLRNCRESDCAALAELQKATFPTLAEGELLAAEHFRQHVERFAEGQFAIFEDEKLVASTSTMRSDFDFEHLDHTFFEFTGGLTFSTHNPAGAWLYGADMAVAEAFRGRGLARQLYRARQEFCQKMGLRGQVLAGMPSGFARFRAEMTIDEYVEKVKTGAIYDPTVSVQMRMGAEFVALVKNYLDDPDCSNAGVLMVLSVEKTV